MKKIVAMTLIGLALLTVPTVKAHPCFVGRWQANLPCGPVDAYDFGPAQYVAPGMWVGCLSKSVAGVTVSVGNYELRMWSANEGTISIREGDGIGTAVGTVDLAGRKMEYLGTSYRH